jgi:hypothetical protein
MPQQDEPGAELRQVAATLAAGMLSSRNPQSWDRNAAQAVEVFYACVRVAEIEPARRLAAPPLLDVGRRVTVLMRM